MVIEHVFVTTLDAREMLIRASEYLSARGFKAEKASKFSLESEEMWTSLEMERGKKNPARAKSILDLPQRVRIEWDRGRVTTALSIGVNATWGGGFGGREVARKMRLHSAMLDAIARGLENLLAHNGAGAADYGMWDEIEAAVKAAARRRRNIVLAVLFIVLALLAAVVTLIVVHNANN